MRRTEGEWLAWFTPHQRNRRKKGRPQAAFRVCDPALSHCNESALASETGRDATPRPSFSGSGAPECDGACDGSRPGPYGVVGRWVVMMVALMAVALGMARPGLRRCRTSTKHGRGK